MKWVLGVSLSAAFLGVIAWTLRMLTGAALTGRETGVLSVLLMVVSVVAAWIVTHIYAQLQMRDAIASVRADHQANLRTYARNAAEKVTNLSNELTRLSAFVREELIRTGAWSLELDRQHKQERLASVAHIVDTLRSVNDTALSDWQGVIGDELEQQREETEERDEELAELTERLESLPMTHTDERRRARPQDVAAMDEIEELRSELRAVLARERGAWVKLRAPRPSDKREVEQPCPSCGASVKYRQRAKLRSVKAIRCVQCGANLIGRFSADKGHWIQKREPVTETAPCPACAKPLTVTLDNLPGTKVAITCGECSAQVTALKLVEGVRLVMGVMMPTSVLTEETIEEVLKRLPQQPWPKGTQQRIARELKVSQRTVSRAMFALVKRGQAFPQIDGVVYRPQAT